MPRLLDNFKTNVVDPAKGFQREGGKQNERHAAASFRINSRYFNCTIFCGLGDVDVFLYVSLVDAEAEADEVAKAWRSEQAEFMFTLKVSVTIVY